MRDVTINPQVSKAGARRPPLSEAQALLDAGLVITLIVGLVFRVTSQLVLVPFWPLATATVFALTVPVVWALMVGIFRWRGLSSGVWRKVTVLLVVPGMLTDAVSTALFSVVYPNVGLEAMGLPGGLLLLAYATVLVAGFVSRWKIAIHRG